MRTEQIKDGFFTRRTTTRAQLGAAVSLVGLAIVFAGIARTTDVGATRIAEPSKSTFADLRFEDGPGGMIRVTDISRGGVQVTIAPGEDGFVRTAMRSLARERQAGGFGTDVPFRLGRTDDGRLWLRDLATGRLLYLDAYGPQNTRSFARLVGFESRSEK